MKITCVEFNLFESICSRRIVLFFIFSLYSYRVSNFNQLPVPTGSAQLVMAATAAHWFDPIEEFYSEAERALCPGGTLALVSYSYPQFDSSHKYHEELNKAHTKVSRKPLLCVPCSACQESRSLSPDRQHLTHHLATRLFYIFECDVFFHSVLHE